MKMANDPYKVYGRQRTDSAKVLGEMLENNPSFLNQYIQAISNITNPQDEPVGAISKAKMVLDKLRNEEILIYLADSLRNEDTRYKPAGLYREGEAFEGAPDTAFVPRHADPSFVDWKIQAPHTGIHEALLHGSGGRHINKRSGETWWGGRLGADLVNYFYPGSYPSREEVRKSSQGSYLNEEEALIESMKESNLYDRYVESLMEKFEE